MTKKLNPDKTYVRGHLYVLGEDETSRSFIASPHPYRWWKTTNQNFPKECQNGTCGCLGRLATEVICGWYDGMVYTHSEDCSKCKVR